MRSDMAKVIVERPRYKGHATKYRERRNELKHELNRCIHNDNYDLLTDREGIRNWTKSWECKELNENLNPLMRYLRSQVGRSWDQVFSEMCEYINPSSAVQYHIWQHAKDYVEEKTFLNEEGEVYFASDYIYRFSIRGDIAKGIPYLPISESYAIVYVHPGTGLLELVPKNDRYRVDKTPYYRIEVDKWHQCHSYKGKWHLLTFAEIPEPVYIPWRAEHRDRLQKELEATKATHGWLTHELRMFNRDQCGRWVFPDLYDVFLKGKAENSEYYGRKGIYCKSMKELNRKEIKRYITNSVFVKEQDVLWNKVILVFKVKDIEKTNEYLERVSNKIL